MPDYREPEHREAYFTALYRMNLEHGVMPGLVYLYMPELAARYGWDAEQRLWFATLNGCTQNPITSLVMFERQPEPPSTAEKWRTFDDWFNAHWPQLQFDTDRLKNKRNTVKALYSYTQLARAAGSQAALWAGKTFAECWTIAQSVHSFGRLSAFSYLEYVRIMGVGPQCDDLMFGDAQGSRSHRNGLLFLLGHDDLVWDKRAANGFDGKYDYGKMVPWLAAQADAYLRRARLPHPDAGYFTLESQLCQFKNHFFSRRFPGVYSDMAWERIERAEQGGWARQAEVFKAIRAGRLPEWLRIECARRPPERKDRAAQFALTGRAYRQEYFLP